MTAGATKPQTTEAALCNRRLILSILIYSIYLGAIKCIWTKRQLENDIKSIFSGGRYSRCCCKQRKPLSWSKREKCVHSIQVVLECKMNTFRKDYKHEEKLEKFEKYWVWALPTNKTLMKLNIFEYFYRAKCFLWHNFFG